MASTEAVPKAMEALTLSKTKELKGVRFEPQASNPGQQM
jgi:hypothetical protein